MLSGVLERLQLKPELSLKVPEVLIEFLLTVIHIYLSLSNVPCISCGPGWRGPGSNAVQATTANLDQVYDVRGGTTLPGA